MRTGKGAMSYTTENLRKSRVPGRGAEGGDEEARGEEGGEEIPPKPPRRRRLLHRTQVV